MTSLEPAVPRPDGIRRFIRPDLLQMAAYEPVEPIEVLAARLGVPADRIIKLDANENPYGPSPRVAETLGRYRGYNIYPDPDQRKVRMALAAYTGAAPEMIVAGAGGDELIDLVCRALLAPGDRVIDIVPAFGMYSFSTAVAGGVCVPVPRRADFSIDLAAVGAAIDERTKIIFATSPNNPTGNRLTAAELDGLLATDVPVVVDEAYIEFCGGSVLPQVAHRDNLIVIRTLSKWAGLAGMRAGYGVMPLQLAETLMTIKQPYNLTVATEAAMLVSLEDRELLMERVNWIVAERTRLFAALGTIPFLRPWPSEANFILCDVTRGSARALRDALRQRGIFIRYYGRAALRDRVRISVGRPSDTDVLIAALREMGEAPRE